MWMFSVTMNGILQKALYSSDRPYLETLIMESLKLYGGCMKELYDNGRIRVNTGSGVADIVYSEVVVYPSDRMQIN